MSLNAALSNAISGLFTASKASELIASNVSNAQTPGYVHRNLSLSARSGEAGGVIIDAVQRHQNEYVVAQRRSGEGQFAHTSYLSDFFSILETEYGTLGKGRSLTDAINTLEARLIEASGQPDNSSRLSAAYDALNKLSSRIRSFSEVLQQERQKADRAIEKSVDKINALLSKLHTLNRQLGMTEKGSGAKAGLLDQQNQLIDELSVMVSVKIFRRTGGKIAIYGDGGLKLLDETASKLSFVRINVISAHDSVENGQLSELKIDGQPIGNHTNFIHKGGSLSSAFTVRDKIAPDAQKSLDSFAYILSSEFSSTVVDPTLSTTDPGLFTDNGQTADFANITGLAGRLVVNHRLSLDSGRSLWRLREGLGAKDETSTGRSDILSALAKGCIRKRTLG